MPDAAHPGIVFCHAVYVLGHGLLCGVEALGLPTMRIEIRVTAIIA